MKDQENAVKLAKKIICNERIYIITEKINPSWKNPKPS